MAVLTVGGVSLYPEPNRQAAASKTAAAAGVTLAPPVIISNASLVFLTENSATPAPAGSRIYYKFDGDPGDSAGEPASGTLYQSAIRVPVSGGTLYARVFPPAGGQTSFKTSTAATLVMAPQSLTNYMGDCNVIVFTNLDTSTAIEGKSWVGGDLTNSGAFSLGRNHASSDAENVAVVGGVLGDGDSFCMEGSSHSRLALTSPASRGTRSIHWNGGGDEAGRLVYDRTIPFKTQTMQKELGALSQKLSAAPASSTVVTPPHQSSKRVFLCTPNAAGIAVFNIAGSSLFGKANISEISISFASGVDEASIKGILINVSGTVLQARTPFNITGKFTDDAWRKKILWNFPAAETLHLAGQGMDGAVLAPSASVTSSNSFRGSVACSALKLSGTCFHLPFRSLEILAMGL